MKDLFIKQIRLDRLPDKKGYPWGLPVVKNLAKAGGLDFHSPVTFFVGENGIGKSTLIEAIALAMGFNPEGGSKSFRFSTEDSHSQLSEHLLVTRSLKRQRDGFFLRAESFYNVASYIDELDRQPSFSPPIINSYGGVSLHKQSHGESFLALVENRFNGNGLYILDEPEAALSPARLMRLMVLIRDLVEKGSQFIISTHSPFLLSMKGAKIYDLDAAPAAVRQWSELENVRAYFELFRERKEEFES
jgi:predicted ATPase